VWKSGNPKEIISEALQEENKRGIQHPLLQECVVFMSRLEGHGYKKL
jgi:hypothetical protein